MPTPSLTFALLLYVLDLAGVAVFAISGTLAGVRAGLDIFGILIVAGVTAIGGGTVRDVLMNRHPIFWMRDTTSLYVIAATVACTIVVAAIMQPPGGLGAMQGPLLVADALGLALFALMGAQIAEAQKFASVVVVMLGTMSGVAGGVIRDLLTSQTPLILQRDIYATAAIAGICVYLLLQRIRVGRTTAFCLGIITVAALRLAAIRYNWHLPTFTLPG